MKNWKWIILDSVTFFFNVGTCIFYLLLKSLNFHENSEKKNKWRYNCYLRKQIHKTIKLIINRRKLNCKMKEKPSECFNKQSGFLWLEIFKISYAYLVLLEQLSICWLTSIPLPQQWMIFWKKCILIICLVCPVLLISSYSVASFGLQWKEGWMEGGKII